MLVIYNIYIDRSKDNNHDILWFNKKKKVGINEAKIKGLNLFRQILSQSQTPVGWLGCMMEGTSNLQFGFRRIDRKIWCSGFNLNFSIT